MYISEIIIGATGLLTTIVSGWASWFFTRKKYDTEVDSNYIENLSKGLETYDTIIAHNKTEIEHLMRENEELRREIAELRKQVLNLTMNICMDLTCANRVREQLKRRTSNGKDQDRLDETEDSSSRRHQPTRTK